MIEEINDAYKDMSKSQRKIADYILEHQPA